MLRGYSASSTAVPFQQCEVASMLLLGSFRFDYEYEIRLAKRMLYAYAIPY